MVERRFRDAELQGWDRKAGYWDDTLGAVAAGAISPLLDAAEAGPGVRLLDLACGTGALAAAAARSGAEVIGMDFAPTMIAEATRRHVGIEFQVADAEAIPLGDASVDAVTCSFGMLHMERPERVFAEIGRVLRPRIGRFAMTAWTADGDLFALVGQAMQAHADMGVPLPPAPPIFRFGDAAACRSALLSSGFVEVMSRPLPLLWSGETPEAVRDLLYRGTVRMPMLIEAQTLAIQAAIDRFILQGAERYRQDDGRIRLRWPALLTVARKP